MPRKPSRLPFRELFGSVDPAPASVPGRTTFLGLPVFATVVILVVVGTAGILKVKRFFGSMNSAPTSQQVQQDAPTGAASSTHNDLEIEKLLAQISKHIAFKKDETPTVATIQDIKSLQAQNPDFYKDAQNGDRLVIWSDKAILYSTTQDRLLAVVPVSLPPTIASTAPSMEVASSSISLVVDEQAQVEVRNGSGTRGKGRLVADRLKQAGLSALSPTDAGNQAYSQTIIVAPSSTSFVHTLDVVQAVTGGQVTQSLPDGEKPLKGDILVIVGVK